MFESVGLQEKFEKEVESKALRTARPWRARLFGTTYRKVRLTLPDVERRLRAELEEEARSRVSADGGRLAPGLRMERSSSTSCVGQFAEGGRREDQVGRDRVSEWTLSCILAVSGECYPRWKGRLARSLQSRPTA